MNVKEPSLDYGDPEFEQIRQHINDFEDVLLGESFKDPVNGYAAYIDVDSFVDWFLVNEIAKNVDAQWYSSIFLHYVPGDKIYMGPIWDFDLGSEMLIMPTPIILNDGGSDGILGSVEC